MGMTAFTSSDDVNPDRAGHGPEPAQYNRQNGLCGKEEAIDAATAISGVPAYVCFHEIDDGRRPKWGSAIFESELLVSQTFRGAIELFNKTDFTCEEWIEKVCSKGGTTEILKVIIKTWSGMTSLPAPTQPLQRAH